MAVDLLVLSRYGPLGASSRIRIYQYLPYLRAAGLNVDVCALFDDAYVRARNDDEKRPAATSVITAYLQRLAIVLAKPRAKALWIEYEALPWLPFTLEGRLYASGLPVIVDYDDAIFHRYDSHANRFVRRVLGSKIARIMRAATLVVAGNDYLAQYAREAGVQRIEMLPSVIDLARYRQRTTFDDREFVIGWVGSRATTPYLRRLQSVLQTLAAQRPVRLVNVGGSPWSMPGVRVDNLPWSESTEVEDMLQFDVGVMPLPDEPWTRGKCGFKLIQYMGCALPTIASPVGANATIVEHDVTGFLAATADEWAQALRSLAASPALRRTLGRRGYAKAAREYSLEATAPRLVQLVQRILAQARS